MREITFLPIIHSPTKTTIFSYLMDDLYCFPHNEQPRGKRARRGLPGPTFFGILKVSAFINGSRQRAALPAEACASIACAKGVN
jgi:hypothetical protein